jgi:flagellar M-ring protein FliF
MSSWWLSLDQRARAGVLAGTVLIVLATGVAAWWLLRTEYAVLFTDLKPQDAGAMSAELEKLKVPYQVADGGATLLVDKAQVHTTRLKLMGKDLPLHGAVGMELFNNAEFGMTEFAQKINYQRALQGELTRTILSFDEIRDARVHLALPEQSLFKQATTRPKAAVTLTLRSGRSLRAEQVTGIQRLVAAAVPGLAAQEVTVVDNQGVALNRSSESDSAGAGGRLDLKRETENYLSRKAALVLERAFGPGQALASVDVTLNMDQVRVTTEDVIAAPEGRTGVPTGVLVKERESTRDNAASEAAESRGQRASSTQREVEYQAGRRVEQVVGQPGSVRRIHVVAVVREPLSAQRQEQVRDMLAAAVGASLERGDTVQVHSFAAAAVAQEQVSAPPQPTADGAGGAGPVATPGIAGQLVGAFAVAAALVVVFLLVQWRASRGRARPAVLLTDNERRVALRKVSTWLEASPGAGVANGALLKAPQGLE